MKCTLVVIMLASCKSDPMADYKGAHVEGCPLPVPEGAYERFAVGSKPALNIDDARGGFCRVGFEPDEKMLTAVDGPKLIAAGRFKGKCKGGPTVQLVAVVPEVVSIRASEPTLDPPSRKISTGPIVLDASKPNHVVTLGASVADRCGTWISMGSSRDVTTWTPDAGCERVVKLMPIDNSPSEEKQLVPVGAGTCKIKATLLGASNEISVAVK